jgi:hypothetical protein
LPSASTRISWLSVSKLTDGPTGRDMQLGRGMSLRGRCCGIWKSGVGCLRLSALEVCISDYVL